MKSVYVNKGDCYFLCLSDGDEAFHIMIDCCCYNDQVQTMVESTLQKHIHLLVVTHIDGDHVNGVISMLEKVPDLIVDEIWFNCYQCPREESLQPLNDYQTKRLDQLKGQCAVEADVADSKIDAEKACLLTEAILWYEQRTQRTVWRRNYLTTSCPDIPLGTEAKWGSIHLLSPSSEQLQRLDGEFRKMFRNLFYDKYQTPLEGKENIYELMILYLQRKEEQLQQGEKIAAVPVNSLDAFKRLANTESTDTTASNQASIAFVWSHGHHRILFAGDASHEQLVQSMENWEGINKPLVMDAIKISHHGSLSNTSGELLDWVDSAHYFIPCGTKKVPALEVMAKILTRQLPTGVPSRIIHYNKATANIQWMIGAETMLAALPPYQLTDLKEYEFDC